MVDTFRPLELGEGGRAVDDGEYAWSWSRGGSRAGGGRREADGSDYTIG
jgi:homogentisate 1,2-dioxygenase